MNPTSTAAPAFDWGWEPQADPPAPRAVVAWGAVAHRLHRRLSALDADRQARLSATASRDFLVVSGETQDIPWLEGIGYAAPCAEAPGLWLPTLHRPDLPCDLIADALRRRHARQPLLLWPTPQALVPLDRLLPLSTQHLQRIASHWLGRGAGA